ncbi:hypothetical protein [Paenibacillus pedocola]|uniref:hypothetical protein n=1 Tax=Paenibacillus pedocola TaxID=3242193 RepID=UPI002877FF6E|nr:hypothetical protein [Paenibacillus typhae]
MVLNLSSLGHKDVYLLSQLADEVMSNEERIYMASVCCEGANEEDILLLMNKIGTVNMERFDLRSIVFGYKTHGLECLTSFVSWIERAAAEVKALHLTGTWNIHIEGCMRKGETLHQLLAPIELYICADEVDSSSDEKEYNTHYYSGLFHGTRMIGDEYSNLQIMAKPALPDNQWRITLGTPSIIIEPYDVH